MNGLAHRNDEHTPRTTMTRKAKRKRLPTAEKPIPYRPVSAARVTPLDVVCSVEIIGSARRRVGSMYSEVANASINRPAVAADEDDWFGGALERLLRAVREFECDLDELESNLVKATSR